MSFNRIAWNTLQIFSVLITLRFQLRKDVGASTPTLHFHQLYYPIYTPRYNLLPSATEYNCQNQHS